MKDLDLVLPGTPDLLQVCSPCIYAPVGSQGKRWDLETGKDFGCIVLDINRERGLVLAAPTKDRRWGRGDAIAECKIESLVLDLRNRTGQAHAAWRVSKHLAEMSEGEVAICSRAAAGVYLTRAETLILRDAVLRLTNSMETDNA